MIAQQKREGVIEKMLQEGAPKSVYKIKELQDKLAAVKEGIRRDAAAKARYEELINTLSEQEQQMMEKESKLNYIAKQNNIKFHDLEEPIKLTQHQDTLRKPKTEKEVIDR